MIFIVNIEKHRQVVPLILHKRGTWLMFMGNSMKKIRFTKFTNCARGRSLEMCYGQSGGTYWIIHTMSNVVPSQINLGVSPNTHLIFSLNSYFEQKFMVRRNRIWSLRLSTSRHAYDICTVLSTEMWSLSHHIGCWFGTTFTHHSLRVARELLNCQALPCCLALVEGYCFTG